ncbi:CAZyme family GT32 [Penicillium lagena]|uniref:CAZyme family GT32 n=1 Tax=Penicillium lagena TaxID=94218 RepID=UPI00254143A3|nr:CAZyme family GT32 [Penicillium lagena]KAJ5605849.1 CAZyme family GT32 [Penicillium lagena]
MLRGSSMPLLWFPRRFQFATLLAIQVVFMLIHCLPELNSMLHADRDYPADRPRYWHHSSFRANPDSDYELSLTNAFRDLETQELARDPAGGAPNTIWQILLAHPEHRGDDSFKLEERNEEWAYKLVSHEWAEEFITKTLASIPGLARLYHSYPHYVQRGDLLRYLILWYYGGYYSDIDVFPKHPIKECPSLRDSIFDIDNPDVSLVVGVEIDEPFASEQEMKYWRWARRYGFLQYTMYAPRRFSPLLREVVIRVLSHTKQHIDDSWFGGRYNEMTTLEVTGPGVFTDAILDVMSRTLPAKHPLVTESVQADAGLGDLVLPRSRTKLERVTWAPFHGIQQPLCVGASAARPGAEFGGLCVLPINSWGNGQRHSGAEGFESTQACINHRFGGTWKPWKMSWKEYLFG